MPTNRGKSTRKDLIAAFLAGHSALGLAFAAIAYLICLSGTIAVFAHELKLWEQPEGLTVQTVSDEAVGNALNALLGRDPKAARDAISATLPTPALPRLVLSAGGADGGDGQSWIANARGDLVERERHPVTDFVIALHARLMIPNVLGLAVVGLVGIAMLALTISGILAHSRIFKDAFRMRRGNTSRLEQADLHNRLGTWGLPFHLMIAFTGGLLGTFFLTFAGIAGTAYQGDITRGIVDLVGPISSGERRPVELGAIAPLIAKARGASAATVMTVDVQHPGTVGERIGVTLRPPGSPLTVQRLVFDRGGRLLFSNAHATIPQQIVSALQPLHFGWFGGKGVEIIYGLLGLSLCIVISSGMKIWFVRRQAKARPAPTWEHLWVAIEWGQPCALAFAAAAGLVTSADTFVPLIWGSATILGLIGSFAPISPANLSIALKRVAAYLLFAVAVVHSWTSGLAWSNVTAFSVDIILAVAAVVLIRVAVVHSSTASRSSSS